MHLWQVGFAHSLVIPRILKALRDYLAARERPLQEMVDVLVVEGDAGRLFQPRV